MKLCRLGAHRPSDRMTWNAGHHFTRCARCGEDLVRAGGRWWRLPVGYLVRWRPKTDADIFGCSYVNPDRRHAVRRLPKAWAERPPY